MLSRLETGEVIAADPNWDYGCKDDENGMVTVGFQDTPGRHFHINDAGYDSTRPHALFVVIEARLAGGGTGMGPHDRYEAGWQVTARRLNEAGTDDGLGEVVYFYQSGCFTCMSWPRVVGKKRLLAVD